MDIETLDPNQSSDDLFTLVIQALTEAELANDFKLVDVLIHLTQIKVTQERNKLTQERNELLSDVKILIQKLMKEDV